MGFIINCTVVCSYWSYLKGFVYQICLSVYQFSNCLSICLEFSSQGKFLLDMIIQGRKDTSFELNELGELSQATIILGKSVNKPLPNSHWLKVLENISLRSKFKARSHVIFFSWTLDLPLINFLWLFRVHCISH